MQNLTTLKSQVVSRLSGIFLHGRCYKENSMFVDVKNYDCTYSDFLKNVLNEIENGLKDELNIDTLATKFALSQGHLCRLFRFALGQSLGNYIRSRKLAASINDLLLTDNNILDILLDYGFEYEQSYIRAFKREFGITPGKLRKRGPIVKITPPLHYLDTTKLGDGSVYGPDMVVIPQFHVIGKKHTMPFHKTLGMATPLAKQFFNKERQKIPNAVNPDALMNICFKAEEHDDEYFYFMPAVQVSSLAYIPEGFDGYSFPTSLCANFRFTNFFLDEINEHTANGMFKAIDDFNSSEEQKYFVDRSVNIDKLNVSDKNGNYLQWEWFAPVIEKTSLKIAPYSPSGIEKVYQQKVPALRFIGKKCAETAEKVDILNLLDAWQLNSRFDAIENQSSVNYGAYINLVRKKEDGVSEHWMGMFMPAGTKVPKGYAAVDFPRSTLAVCSVYGKRDEIVDYEAECRNELAEEELSLKNSQWYFRRFNWRGFYKVNIYGKRQLEYCFFCK